MTVILSEIIRKHIPLFGAGKVIEADSLSSEKEINNQIGDVMNAILKHDDLDFSYKSWAQTFEDSAKTPVYEVDEKKKEHFATFYSVDVPFQFAFASRLREIIQESNPQILSFVKEKFYFNNSSQHFGDFRGLFFYAEAEEDYYQFMNLGFDEKRFKELCKEKRFSHIKFIDYLASENIERQTKVKEIIPAKYFETMIKIIGAYEKEDNPSLFNKSNIKLWEQHHYHNRFEIIEEIFHIRKLK